MAVPAGSLAAWLAVLVLSTASACQASQHALFGTVQIVVVHARDDSSAANATAAREEHHIHLKLPSGELRRLLFPEEDAQELPRTGAHVMVRPQPMAACAPQQDGSGVICVGMLMAHEAAPRDVFASGQPRGKVTAKVLLIQLNVCNWGIPSPDWDALEGAMWLGLPSSQDNTVEGMFKACSFGMAQVTKAAGGYMLRQEVPIPCSGTTPQGQGYDSTQCPFNEWSDVANDWLRTNVPQLRLEDYPFKVYIVPKGSVCAWGGMGYVGCHDDCRAWINGDLWMKPTTLFHEISHNLYLNHAGKWGSRGYEDMSGAMGYCCDLRCHNAPHSHQLGWAGPVKTLHKDNWPAGTWNTYMLPAATTNPKNFIRIWPDWSSDGAKNKLYIQYRKRVGYDSGLTLNGAFGDKVNVYSADAADPQPYTSWEAGVDAGQQWREARLRSSIVVKVPRFDGDAAEVRVCRATEDTERSCGNGLDDDCNGKADAEDPACAGGGGGGGGGSGGAGGASAYSGAGGVGGGGGWGGGWGGFFGS